MIEFYMNQNIALKSKTSVNDYNESFYDESIIKGRFEYSRKLVKNIQGDEVISEAILYTKTNVKTDDVITYDEKDWNVMNSKPQIDLFGNIIFYEVRL